jgi:hypothetical protein
MFFLMYIQITYVPECFTTHMTTIWTHPRIYTLMYLQIFEFAELFVTHNTAIWTLLSIDLALFTVPCCLDLPLLASCETRKEIIMLSSKETAKIMKIDKQASLTITTSQDLSCLQYHYGLQMQCFMACQQYINQMHHLLSQYHFRGMADNRYFAYPNDANPTLTISYHHICSVTVSCSKRQQYAHCLVPSPVKLHCATTSYQSQMHLQIL